MSTLSIFSKQIFSKLTQIMWTFRFLAPGESCDESVFCDLNAFCTEERLCRFDLWSLILLRKSPSDAHQPSSKPVVSVSRGITVRCISIWPSRFPVLSRCSDWRERIVKPEGQSYSWSPGQLYSFLHYSWSYDCRKQNNRRSWNSQALCSAWNIFEMQSQIGIEGISLLLEWIVVD